MLGVMLMNGYGFDYVNYIANVPGNMNYSNIKPNINIPYGYMNSSDFIDENFNYIDKLN